MTDELRGEAVTSYACLEGKHTDVAEKRKFDKQNSD